MHIDRVLAKSAWLSLDSKAKGPAWPLHKRTPAIATFYSFKGGVGRTTLVGAIAWQFARQGNKVVVVDLDLEAPGVARMFGATAHWGALDFLMDHMATGAHLLPELPNPTDLPSPDRERIHIVPAGRLDWNFVEKLARLDFSSTRLDAENEPAPALLALRALLEAIRRQLTPDYILLDARAGLHDVSGLSLFSLSHVNVLVTRANQQNLDGLEVVLESMRLNKSPREFLCSVVHNLAPPVSRGKARDQEIAEWRVSRGGHSQSGAGHWIHRARDKSPEPRDRPRSLRGGNAGQHAPHLLADPSMLLYCSRAA
ncbi:MAG: AAA family ATPase [Deltaproteobacteria bacterium]|nr:AAA family ATPase [Deltaproteobacteria bacterium]